MMEILKDVKVAVKEGLEADVRTIDEVVELLGLEIEGTLKEKIHAAAMELDVSIFVEVCDLLWAQLTTTLSSFFIYISLVRKYFPPWPQDAV